MTYSSTCKYRGTRGTLTIGAGNLTFSRMDGVLARKFRIVTTIPTYAIQSVRVERAVLKKLVVLVDQAHVGGIPRHEFAVPDPEGWMGAIQQEMSAASSHRTTPSVVVNVNQHAADVPAPQVVQQVLLRCQYCKTVYPESSSKCPNCGATF